MKIKFILAKTLESHGKSKYWLSKQTGIDIHAITKICDNKSSQIKIETLEKICYALNCDVSDIIKCKKNKKTEYDFNEEDFDICCVAEDEEIYDCEPKQSKKTIIKIRDKNSSK